MCRSGIQMVSTWMLWFRSTVSGAPAGMLLMDMDWTAGAGQTSLYPHTAYECDLFGFSCGMVNSGSSNFLHRSWLPAEWMFIEERNNTSFPSYSIAYHQGTDSERRGYTRLWIPRGMVHLRRPHLWRQSIILGLLILTESLWLVNISGSDDVHSNLPEIEKLLGRLRIEYTEI